MSSFCHRLEKGSDVCLFVTKNGSNLMKCFYVLMRGTLCFTFSLKSKDYPESERLLKPVKKLEINLFQKKITLRADGALISKNQSVNDCPLDEAMTEIAERFSEVCGHLSKTNVKTERNASVKEEACELLMKIEEQRDQQLAKYILLLNEKKKKIRQLQRQLGVAVDSEPDDFGLDVESGPPDDAQPSSSKEVLAVQAGAKDGLRGVGIREDESESDEDSDGSDDSFKGRAEDIAENLEENDSEGEDISPAKKEPEPIESSPEDVGKPKLKASRKIESIDSDSPPEPVKRRRKPSDDFSIESRKSRSPEKPEVRDKPEEDLKSIELNDVDSQRREGASPLEKPSSTSAKKEPKVVKKKPTKPMKSSLDMLDDLL